MEDNYSNPNLSESKLPNQPDMPIIPNISSIPPIPEIKNDTIHKADEATVNNNPSQQTNVQPPTQNTQARGFNSTHLEYANQQNQYANQNLGYAGSPSNNQNNNNPGQQQNYGYGAPRNVLINIPNSGGILTLGILSIVSFCCCPGLLAPILSIIALAMIPKAKRLYSQNPQFYKLSSLNNMKAGQICAIIGISLAVILWIYLIILMIIDGINFNDVNEAFNEAWNETGY